MAIKKQSKITHFIEDITVFLLIVLINMNIRSKQKNAFQAAYVLIVQILKSNKPAIAFKLFHDYA